MQRLKVPDFFIVGAPKCGTTALFNYLEQHPDVFVPDTKELNYFCTDLHATSCSGLSSIRTKEKYLAKFACWGTELRAGEASPWYLYSERAAENISVFAPGSRVIAILRNPVDMVYAMHSQLVRGGFENISRFEEAWAAAKERRQGKKLPKRDFDLSLTKLLQYDKIALFSRQVERYCKVFESDRFLILLYDEFQRNPKLFYETLLRFLGVDDTHEPEFRTVNANRVVRNELVWRISMYRPKLIRKASRAIIPLSTRRWLMEWISRVNTIEQSRAPMREDTRAALREYFKPEVFGLSDLLNRDLMPWVETPEGTVRESQGRAE